MLDVLLKIAVITVLVTFMVFTIALVVVVIKTTRKERGESSPHPLTLDELRRIPPGAVLWIDDRDLEDEEDPFLPMVPTCFEGFRTEQLDGEEQPEEHIVYSDGLDSVESYGKGFILWDGRPTDEQRKRTKF